ncbi:hypothetical protein ACO0LF_18700 [Undibacterium sp. Di27W]|uniref:hypothetical protein n=1 Tax=Undibacterium sp. Di27W TaxID=3413036 RepID=UPI003BF18D7A
MNSRLSLLSIEEIQTGLNKEFQHLEPELSGYRLLEDKMPSTYLADLENRLSVKFPEDFRQLISEFNFGNLVIGPIGFGSSCLYTDELLKLNTQVQWWGHGARPASLIMVANSDPFAIILDVCGGHMLAMDAELGYERATRIARSFDAFFIGLGTAILLRNQTEKKEEMAQAIADAVGSKDIGFWYFLTR